MSRTRRPTELHHTARQLAIAADRCQDEILQVLRFLREWSAGATHSADGPSPKNQVSRPTEAQALGHDQFARMRDRLIEQLLVADRAMREVDSIRREVMSGPPPARPAERGLAKCCNMHGCPDDAWAVKAGRCDTCYRYRARTDRDRRVAPESTV